MPTKFTPSFQWLAILSHPKTCSRCPAVFQIWTIQNCNLAELSSHTKPGSIAATPTTQLSRGRPRSHPHGLCQEFERICQGRAGAKRCRPVTREHRSPETVDGDGYRPKNLHRPKDLYRPKDLCRPPADHGPTEAGASCIWVNGPLTGPAPTPEHREPDADAHEQHRRQ